MGRWNGFGGKVLDGETIEECLVREVEEEAGIKLDKFEKVGILEFEFSEGGQGIEAHVFKTDQFIGEPKETEEMKPQWFFIDEIPFDQMWPDDAFWMPLFLKGKKFKGKFLLDRPSNAEYQAKILEKELEEVENI